MKHVSWLLVTAASVSTMVLVGCGGGDDDAAAPIPTPVVVTNIVVVPTPAPAPVPAPTPAPANVAGTWNGPKQTGSGDAHFVVALAQSGTAITGTFTGPSVSGNVSGTITVADGDHLVLYFTYLTGASAGYAETWDGHFNSMIDEYLGTWTPNNGGMSNTFGLQK